jgi:hypothetical protein
MVVSGAGCLVREVYPGLEGLMMELDISRDRLTTSLLSMRYHCVFPVAVSNTCCSKH